MNSESVSLDSYPNGVLHSVTFVTHYEISDLYEATTAYEPTFHILFIVLSAYRRKYKLTAALFRHPRHETLHNSEHYFDGGKNRFLVPEAP
jgi:hypothetical protein